MSEEPLHVRNAYPGDHSPETDTKSIPHQHGQGNSNSHGARPVRQIISMTKWVRTSRFSIKNSFSLPTRPPAVPLTRQASRFTAYLLDSDSRYCTQTRAVMWAVCRAYSAYRSCSLGCMQQCSSFSHVKRSLISWHRTRAKSPQCFMQELPVNSAGKGSARALETHMDRVRERLH